MQELEIVDRVLGREIEPIVVLLPMTMTRISTVTVAMCFRHVEKKEAYITVNVVGVNGIASLGRGELDAVPHDAANIVAVEVQPALVGPSVKGLAQIRLVEPALIRPEGLVRTGAEVANDLPVALQRLECLRVVVKEVQVPDGHIRAGGSVCELDGALEHDLPRRVDAGLPCACAVAVV